MTKAKQNLAKYNEARAGGREKLQPLFDEKNKKRAAIKELFGDNPEEMKKQSKAMRTKLNAQWKEKNKDLIAKYQELYQQKKLDEETFQKGLEEFRKLNPEIDEEALRDLIMGKSEKKESKETFIKSLEFEENTFKINSTDWKEATEEEAKKNPLLNIFVGKSPKVKVNATGDVVEYLEGPAKGEQIFITYDATIREVMKAKNCSKEEVKEKYLLTEDELKEKMKDKPNYSEEYKEFFNKEVKDHLAGYWNPHHKRFNTVGVRSNVWLADGGVADFAQRRWGRSNDFSSFGCSGRLLKN